MKKPLEQYVGRLSPEQIAQGMNAAIRNARRLYEDAKLLFEHGRYPSACSLAILAIEEAGKQSVLRGLATAPNDKQMKAEWRRYRNHQAKNAQWIIMELAAKGARTLDDLKPVFDEKSDHPVVLDTVKQIGFYTDCCGNAHWSEPHNVIDGGLAQSILFTASILVPKHDVTAREIEIWIECVGPYWGTPAMRDGAIEYHRRLEAEGLDKHSQESVARFYGLTADTSH